MIRRKTGASQKADRQLSTGICQPSSSCCHSAPQLLASSLSFYLRMYNLYAKRAAVSDCHTLHNFPFVHDISHANTSKPSKSEKKTLVANSAAFG